jgi:hypothetical protein
MRSEKADRKGKAEIGTPVDQLAIGRDGFAIVEGGLRGGRFSILAVRGS